MVRDEPIFYRAKLPPLSYLDPISEDAIPEIMIETEAYEWDRYAKVWKLRA